MDSTQEEIFDSVAKPIVNAVLEGYNGGTDSSLSVIHASLNISSFANQGLSLPMGRLAQGRLSQWRALRTTRG
jgi:hypothetical protein